MAGHLEPGQKLEGAQQVLERLEQDFPADEYDDGYEVLLLALYSLIGVDGVRTAIGQR